MCPVVVTFEERSDFGMVDAKVGINCVILASSFCGSNIYHFSSQG